jgi:hypothetical protein
MLQKHFTDTVLPQIGHLSGAAAADAIESYFCEYTTCDDYDIAFVDIRFAHLVVSEADDETDIVSFA